MSELEVVGWLEAPPAAPRLLLLLTNPQSPADQRVRASAQGRAGPQPQKKVKVGLKKILLLLKPSPTTISIDMPMQ